MGVKYLWDTNVSIYYLQQQFPAKAEKFIDELLTEFRPCFSVITEIELLCWKYASDKDVEVLSNFINDAVVIELEQSIKLKTADIRKNYKIKLPDAIIAATAFINGYTLLTRNIDDFKSIAGLKLFNPWDV